MQLSGVTVPSERQSVMTAQLRRTQTLLETFLGFTLDSDRTNSNLYTELGILPTANNLFNWTCEMFDWWSYLDTPSETLDPADAVVTAYRLYRYNDKDKFFHVDPFTTLNKVKLIRDGVTVRVFQPAEYRIRRGRDGWSKYIEDCRMWKGVCVCGRSCLQLAVDAEWLWQNQDDIPVDLQFIQAEMATYYGDPTRLLKSEHIGDYSYTKLDDTANRTTLIPQDMPENAATIIRYAGPYGSMVRTNTV